MDLSETAKLSGISGSLIDVGLGVVIGLIAAVFGVTLWMYKDRLKDARAMLMVLALLSLLPMGAMLVQEKTNILPKAAVVIEVVAIEGNMTGEKSAVVYVTLNEPAFAYLEYTDVASGRVRTIVSTGKVEKRLGHSFEIEDVGSEGGTAAVVVNGKPIGGVVKLP